MAGNWNASCRTALALVSLCLLPAAAAMASQRDDTVRSPAGDAMEEVVVTGKTIGEMRRDIERAEDRFYNAYNELNPDGRFRVNCRLEARPGTRILGHLCTAAFFEDAQGEEARGILRSESPTPAEMIYQARLPEFRQNVIKVVAANPQLARLLFERVELQRRYERELRIRQGRSAP